MDRKESNLDNEEIVFNDNGYKIVEEKAKPKKTKKPKKNNLYLTIGIILATIGFLNLGVSVSVNNRHSIVTESVAVSPISESSFAMPVQPQIHEVPKISAEMINTANGFKIDAASVDNLDIQLTVSNLNIYNTENNNQIEIKWNSNDLHTDTHQISDKTLRIFEENISDVADDTAIVELFLPNKVFESIKINSSSSNITSNGALNASLIEINNLSMNTYLDIVKGNNIYISCTYGELAIQNEIVADNVILNSPISTITNIIKCDNLEINSAYGNFNSDSIYANSLNIEAESGNMQLNSIYATNFRANLNYCEFSGYEIKADNLNMQSEAGNIVVNTMLSKDINITNNYGNFEAIQIESENINIKSKTGLVNIQQLISDNSDIEISYGSCNINLPRDSNISLDIENKFGQYNNNLENLTGGKDRKFKFRSDFGDLYLGTY